MCAHVQYRFVRREYKARQHSAAGTMLLEVGNPGMVDMGLAIRHESGTWAECRRWSRDTGNGFRWEISTLDLGDGMKKCFDWSLRGWLYHRLNLDLSCDPQFTATPCSEIDDLARKLEVAAGLADSGPHVPFVRPGAWVNSCGVSYPYAEYGPWWRPATSN